MCVCGFEHPSPPQVVVGSVSVRRKRGVGARTFEVMLLAERPGGECWLRQRWQTAIEAEQMPEDSAATNESINEPVTKRKDKKSKKKKKKKKRRSTAESKAGAGARAPKVPRTDPSSDGVKNNKLALLVSSLQARAEAGTETLNRVFAQVSDLRVRDSRDISFSLTPVFVCVCS